MGFGVTMIMRPWYCKPHMQTHGRPLNEATCAALQKLNLLTPGRKPVNNFNTPLEVLTKHDETLVNPKSPKSLTPYTLAYETLSP